MAIYSLEVQRFRNLLDIKLQPQPGFNFLIGDNGSGKTSLLEAIHCLGRGKSFRTYKTNQLISLGESDFTIVGKLQQQHKSYTIGMQRFAGESHIRMAGHKVQRASELTEVLPIAVLEPGLHRLIEEGPEYRRKFLDWGVFHVEPDFAPVWQTYRRALAQRNAALRASWTQRAIAHWDQELISAGEALDNYRRHYLSQLTLAIQDFGASFPELAHCEFHYYRGWRDGESLGHYLTQQFTSDAERGFTQFGPHRADLRIRTRQRDARDVLSRGQQKMLVAFLVLAQCQQITARQTAAVVLVDDLPAELDSQKRELLMQALQCSGAQVFLTATEQGLFPHTDYPQSQVFHVEQGRISALG